MTSVRNDFVADKSYRIRFENGQELDCKFIAHKQDDPDARLKFVIPLTGTLRIYPFDITVVAEIEDIAFQSKAKDMKITCGFVSTSSKEKNPL